MATYPVTGSSPWGSNLQKYIDANQPRKFYAPDPFDQKKQYTTSGTTAVVGYDQTDNLLILAGQTDIFTSSDNGTTLSAGKGIPLSGQTNPGNQVGRIVRFKTLWVCLIQDQVSLCGAIYTSPAPGAGGTCTWTLRQNLTGGSDGRFGTCIAQDGTQVLVGEYGDPLTTGTKNPHIWRSTDALSWSTTYSASGGNNRHIHAVYPDTYTANLWYASIGDGLSPCLLQSTNGGVTWTGVTAIDSTKQVVQISDDANYLYMAADATAAGGPPCTLWILDKATMASPTSGSLEDHRRIAVPNSGQYTTGRTTSASTTFNDFTAAPFGAHMKGAKITMGTTIPDGTTISSVTNSQTVVLSAAATATVTDAVYQIQGISEQWYSDPFFGVMDPATGIYYFVTQGDSTGLPNVRRAMFYIPYVGGPVQFLDYVNTSSRNILIANGYLHCGNSRRPTLVPVARS